MRKKFGLGLVGLTALAALAGLLTASAAFSANTNCSGTLTGTVNGNVAVSAGNACTLSGATVNGNVTVSGAEATLTVELSTINGNLTATGAADVVVSDSTITGNVTLTGLQGGTNGWVCGSKVGGNVTVTNSTGSIKIGDEGSVVGVAEQDCYGQTLVGGNVVFSGNRADVLQLAGSHVKGNVVVSNNKPGPEEGEEDLANNTIDHNFTCSGNSVKADTDPSEGTDSDFGGLFDIAGTTAGGYFNCATPAGA